MNYKDLFSFRALSFLTCVYFIILMRKSNQSMFCYWLKITTRKNYWRYLSAWSVLMKRFSWFNTFNGYIQYNSVDWVYLLEIHWGVCFSVCFLYLKISQNFISPMNYVGKTFFIFMLKSNWQNRSGFLKTFSTEY